ncbi:MAG TPA: hypothetical protein VF541_18885 [Longimicrobium sp.]|jgi:hypothetical protein
MASRDYGLSTDEYLRRVGPLLKRVKTLAREYKIATGRPLGITGEVAEYEAVRILGLDICEVRQPGYDAICKTGPHRLVQIKGRSLAEGKGGRLGRIDLKKEWDSVMLVLLDESYEPVRIHEATRSAVEQALTKPGSVSRNVRGQLGLSQFLRIAELRWSAGGE